MQNAPGMRPPMGVVFDAAFGDNLDDLLALSLLYHLDTRNDCRVAALTTSKHNVASASLYEVFQKIYGARPTAIGMSTGDWGAATGPLLKAAGAGHETSVKSVLDTAEPPNLIRNYLQAYHDGNAIILCTGPTHNLRDLLALRGAKAIVEAKVKTLWLAGANPKAPEGWPTPIEIVTTDMAKSLQYRPAPEDFAWDEKHPVRQALAADPQTELNRAPLLAALWAVRGKNVENPDTLLSELTAAQPIPRQRFRPPA